MAEICETQRSVRYANLSTRWGREKLVRVQAVGKVREFTPDRGDFSTKLTSQWSDKESGGHRDNPHEVLRLAAPGSHLPPAILDGDRIGLSQKSLALPGMVWWGERHSPEGSQQPRVCEIRELGSWLLRCLHGKARPTSTSSKTQASWEPPTGTHFFQNGHSTPSSGRWGSSNPNPCMSSRRVSHFLMEREQSFCL